MRQHLCSLAAVAVAAGVLAWSACPVHANGTIQSPFQNHSDVQVFAPTPQIHDAVVREPAGIPPVKVMVRVHLDALALDWRYHRAVAWAHRKYRIHRVFGHRYTGFIRMYRGPSYPF